VNKGQTGPSSVPLSQSETSRVVFALSVPRGHYLFALFCVVLVITAVGIAVFGEIDEWVTGEAVLRPVATVSLVRNQLNGAVDHVLAPHGTAVQAGEVLWAIAADAVDIDVSDLETRLAVSELQRAEVAAVLSELTSALAAEITGPDIQRTPTELTSLFAALESIGIAENPTPTESALLPESGVRSQLAALTISAEYRRLTILADNAERVFQRHRAVGTLGSSAVTLQEYETAMHIARIDRDAYLPAQVLKLLEEARSLDTSISGLRQQLTERREALALAAVRAPISGVVEYSRRFQPGDYLIAAEEVATIVPAGSRRFRLEIMVPEREYRRIALGQTVKLRFTALPVGDFGLVPADVVYVPADGRITADGERVVVVLAELDTPTVIGRSGRVHTFHPGQTARARVIVGRVKLWTLLLRELGALTAGG
jgi:multidrug efflux pump subunit AcrA (membrane-fusion protein)